MNIRSTPTAFAATIDDARSRAHELRQQAIRAGWDALGRALMHARGGGPGTQALPSTGRPGRR